MSAANELDAVLSQEELPDEFCRLASNSPPREKPSVAALVSGLVATSEPDGVICPLLLKRGLVVPAWGNGFSVRLATPVGTPVS